MGYGDGAFMAQMGRTFMAKWVCFWEICSIYWSLRECPFRSSHYHKFWSLWTPSILARQFQARLIIPWPFFEQPEGSGIQTTTQLTLHATLPTSLPSTTLLCTQQTQGIVGEMALDIETVWKYCGVNHILFGWFVHEGSIPICTCFHSENFLWLVLKTYKIR